MILKQLLSALNLALIEQVNSFVTMISIIIHLFIDAVANLNAQKASRPILTTDYSCGGAEPSIGNCSSTSYNYTVGRSIQSVTTVAGVTCSQLPPTSPPTICSFIPPQTGVPCSTGDVKFLGSASDRGVLMYCYNSSWSPFCMIDSKVAQVACRQLGFTQYSCEYIIHYINS